MLFKNLICIFVLLACDQSNSKYQAVVLDSKTDSILLKIKNESDMEIIEENLSFQDSICGISSLDYIMGKFDPSTNLCFEKVPQSLADRAGLFLRKETLEAFMEMHQAAKKAGINLKILSATRNFEYQKGIWERKWTGQTKLEGKIDARKINEETNRAKAILKYSAMPGASRHHWGTDIDLNSLENGYFKKSSGEKVYKWLQTKGKEFGFYQVYTEKKLSGRSGYEEEMWHYTYKPLSSALTTLAKGKIINSDFKGFMGANTATNLDIKNNYILGVNNECWH